MQEKKSIPNVNSQCQFSKQNCNSIKFQFPMAIPQSKKLRLPKKSPGNVSIPDASHNSNINEQHGQKIAAEHTNPSQIFTIKVFMKYFPAAT